MNADWGVYCRHMEDAALPNRLLEERPWGAFEQFALNELSTVKLITTRPGEELSLQSHEKRDEFWRVIGGGVMTIGEKTSDAKVGDECSMPRRAKHRARGGLEPMQFLEIATGVFNKTDEKRGARIGTDVRGACLKTPPPEKD